MTEWGMGSLQGGLQADMYGAEVGRTEEVQLVGPHLRLSGVIDLGRFARLSDKVNHTRGYVRIHDARLLRRNGDPTPLVVPVLMVDQDEITFIGQTEHLLSEAPADGPDELMSGDRPAIEKAPRRFVIFTPGHAITGNIHVHDEMTIENFVDASDPRFVVMTSVSARSLADRRVISHFEFLLVNRTQMTAIAETKTRAVAEEVVEASAG